jgi:hypothetical protein
MSAVAASAFVAAAMTATTYFITLFCIAGEHSSVGAGTIAPADAPVRFPFAVPHLSAAIMDGRGARSMAARTNPPLRVAASRGNEPCATLGLTAAQRAADYLHGLQAGESADEAPRALASNHRHVWRRKGS